jgi:hypothetical protein
MFRVELTDMLDTHAYSFGWRRCGHMKSRKYALYKDKTSRGLTKFFYEETA